MAVVAAPKGRGRRRFSDWLHPHGKDGKFIETGGMVNVDQPGGRTRRGKITKLTEVGPQVQYRDDNRTETIPLSQVSERMTQVAPPLARVSDDSRNRIVVTPEARKLADAKLKTVAVYEPDVTVKLADLAGDADPGVYAPPSGDSGKLYGLEHRFKTVESMAEKIERWHTDGSGTTRETAAANMHDALRYTVHFPQGDFGTKAQAMVDELAKDPDTAHIKMSNTWADPTRAYKGINAIVATKDGQVYEVQFHTPASQVAKNKMHRLYEMQRVLPRGSKEWHQLEDELQGISKNIPVPNGAAEITVPV